MVVIHFKDGDWQEIEDAYISGMLGTLIKETLNSDNPFICINQKYIVNLNNVDYIEEVED